MTDNMPFFPFLRMEVNTHLHMLFAVCIPLHRSPLESGSSLKGNLFLLLYIVDLYGQRETKSVLTVVFNVKAPISMKMFKEYFIDIAKTIAQPFIFSMRSFVFASNSSDIILVMQLTGYVTMTS